MQRQKKTVLIIEDDAVLQKLYSVLINNSEDYSVRIYTDDLQAVKTSVKWEEIDIVIADQLLGRHLYGNEILYFLEKEYPQIWRIMLTGDSMINPHETHCNLLLMKPIHPGELLAALRMGNG